MQRRTAKILRFLLATSGLFLAFAGKAQSVYSPVPVTGFTDDVVANLPGPANQSANNDMDGGNAPTRYCFLTQNYVNPSGATPMTWLPATGYFVSKEFTTPGLPFQLADYNANNTMRIKGIGTGTLTFVTPRSARMLFLLGGSGNSQSGPTYFDATINFTDGTSQPVTNLFFTDWFGLLDVVALQGVSRVNFDNNQIESSNVNPSLYQKRLNILPANYGKLIRSVTINKPGAYGTLNVMAISAGIGCPAPPTAGKAVADITNICSPRSIKLSLTGAASDTDLLYQWQESTDNGATWNNITGATQATYTANPTTTTQYRAKLTCGVQTGTSTPVTVTLTLIKPEISYQKTTYCQTGSTEKPIVSPIGGSFTGTDGLAIATKTGMIDLVNSTLGKHTITYTTAPPCVEKKDTTIIIEGSPEVVFPNIITPNGDGINESLQVKVPDLTGYQMRVYSRWGNMVWESSNPTQSWTGEGTSSGIYFYHVNFSDCTGQLQTFKGWVELLR